MATGRNQSCPCGSGIKYKKCCLDRVSKTVNNPAQAVESEEMEGQMDFKALKNTVFSSNKLPGNVENLFLSLKNSLKEFTHKPGLREEDHGLSLDQWYRLTDNFSEEDGIIQFGTIIEPGEKPPVGWNLAFYLLREAYLKPLTLNSKGLLPTPPTQSLFLASHECSKPHHWQDALKLKCEEDFPLLHQTRLGLQHGGFLQVQGKKLSITRLGFETIVEKGVGGILPEVLRIFFHEVRWGLETERIFKYKFQEIFPFAFFLLHKYGDEKRPASDYWNWLMKAFPTKLDELVGDRDAAHRGIGKLFFQYFFNNSLRFLGMVEVLDLECYPDLERVFIKKTPLFQQYLTFHLD